MKIVRVDREHGTAFEVHEGRMWPDSDKPRASIVAEAWRPSLARGKRAQVSWPSTTDKRPELARALADALVLAAGEADELNQDLEQAILAAASSGDVEPSRIARRIDHWTNEELAGAYAAAELVFLAQCVDGVHEELAARLRVLAERS